MGEHDHPVLPILLFSHLLLVPWEFRRCVLITFTLSQHCSWIPATFPTHPTWWLHFFLTHQAQRVLHMYLLSDVWPLLEAILPTGGRTHKENWLPLCQLLSNDNRSLAGSVTWWPHPLSTRVSCMIYAWLCQSYAWWLNYAEFIPALWCLDYSFLGGIHILWLLQSLCPLLTWPPSLGRMGCDTAAFSRTEYPTASQLWVSGLITIYWKTKLLWWGLSDA